MAAWRAHRSAGSETVHGIDRIMGPPLLAPLLVTMVGGMGLLAAILRREGGRR